MHRSATVFIGQYDRRMEKDKCRYNTASAKTNIDLQQKTIRDNNQANLI